ncbi:MAG TPA: response regulator [Phototrophicaceae bacterium]|nr:response regulator [Phototrophicaceae bacterium]
MKIMYVEDNPANISLLQRIARMGGHEVINYTDGEVALNNFEKHQPDLVLMDLQLEGRIGGLDVVKALRARGFKTPIVAVTAYAMVGDRERCIEAGCDSYLSKPLPVTELVELVQKYELKAKEAQAASAVKTTVEVPSGEEPTIASKDDLRLERPTPTPASVGASAGTPAAPVAANPITDAAAHTSSV